MKIVSIDKVPRSRQRLVIHFDVGEALELSAEIVTAAGLAIGTVVDAEERSALQHRDQAWSARETALRMLEYRPRTETELRRRLRRDGIPAEIIDECVARLREQRLIDDGTFAEIFTRDRVRLKPRGRRMLIQELRGRGVEEHTAAAAIDAVLAEEEVDELELAREATRRWRPRPGEEPLRARRRLAGFLARRGFGGEVTQQIIEEVLPRD